MNLQQDWEHNKLWKFDQNQALMQNQIIGKFQELHRKFFFLENKLNNFKKQKLTKIINDGKSTRLKLKNTEKMAQKVMQKAKTAIDNSSQKLAYKQGKLRF